LDIKIIPAIQCRLLIQLILPGHSTRDIRNLMQANTHQDKFFHQKYLTHL
jgi:hypothetical protein